jgi:acid phosphatase type 7
MRLVITKLAWFGVCALCLVASGRAQTLTRGPYLQMGTANGVTVRWRTSGATDSRVRYGPTAGNLNANADNSAVTTEHEVALANLNANTKYFYSVGSAANTLAGDGTYFFTTAPGAGRAIPTRVWVLGDSGTANANAQAVRDAYLNFTGATPTNLWLMLGDNAYNNGTDDEYQAAVFNLYPTTLRQSVLWPTIGNHDTAQSVNPAPTLPYFSIFNLPTNAEAGGLASGTEKYYSFNYSNIHFICLDSMTSDRTAAGPMLTWLQYDLAATIQPWIVAFWHHPPYTKGSHDSDTETPLIEMRANALPLLENYGVDLVLTGHSHAYERSFLLDGHYGASNTFTAAMKKNGGDGRVSGNGAYTKSTNLTGAHEGAVYAVAGSSGQISGGPLNHPAMFISLNNLGSLVVDVNGLQMDVKFIRENGVVADNFTIIKAAPTAAGVSLSGFVLTAQGRAPRGVTVTLSDLYGKTQTTGIDRRGRYSFNDVTPARLYFVNVAGKGYQFTPPTRAVTPNFDLEDLNFTAGSAAGGNRQ